MPIEFITNNQDLIDQVNAFEKEWNSSSTVIYTQTSGSTGTPKTIEIKKKYMIASARATIDFLDIKSGNTALLCLSPKTIGGKMMMVRAFVEKMQLLVVDVSSDPLAQLPENEMIDFAAMVPMQLESSLNRLNRLNSIKKLIIGGAPMSSKLTAECATISPVIFQTFGMTETISHIALKQVNGNSQKHYEALNNVSFEQAENGALIIHAPNIGVLDLPTNDIVELHSSTSFSWLGRSDFAINSGGIKIHPEMIEQQLSQSIALPFFSWSISDDQLGQKHILCIEGNSISKLSKEVFAEHLGKLEIPKEVHYFSQFVYTESGKINRSLTFKQTADVVEKVL